MLGLHPHLLHQPGALDHVGEAGIVLDVGGDGHLAAGLDALDEQRLQHGARGIDAGRIAGRARADDDQLGVAVTSLVLPWAANWSQQVSSSGALFATARAGWERIYPRVSRPRARRMAQATISVSLIGA